MTTTLDKNTTQLPDASEKITLRIENKHTATLAIGTHHVMLLRPRHFATRAAGLLNHASLPSHEGLLFGRTHLLHTFGMRFPIVMLGFDKHGVARLPPKFVPPNRIVWMPLGCKFVAEISPDCPLPFSATKVPPLAQWVLAAAKHFGIAS